MAEAQRKTVPFPEKEKKEIPVVDMRTTLVERFAVPAMFLTTGIAIGFLIGKVSSRKKDKEIIFARHPGV